MQEGRYAPTFDAVSVRVGANNTSYEESSPLRLGRLNLDDLSAYGGRTIGFRHRDLARVSPVVGLLVAGRPLLGRGKNRGDEDGQQQAEGEGR